jgi:hypothetical protein
MRVLVAALAAAAAPLSVPAADASIGAGIGASPIELAGAAQPGHNYRLPAVYVENTGSEPARYELRVERLSAGSGRAVPVGWVLPARNGFLLAAHKSTRVALTLQLPSNAPAGGYLSDVVAAAAPGRPARGTVLGAAAATKLIFQVADPGVRLPGWVIKTLIALAVAGLTLYAIRRGRVRIRFEHGHRT